MVAGSAGADPHRSARRRRCRAEPCEHGVDVALDVVGVGRDAEVAVPLGGDDPVRRQCGDERRRVRRADADERAAPFLRAGGDDDAAELVDPGDQPLVEAVDVSPRLGDPELLDQLDAGDARVDRRHRRRPRLEAARRRRRRVVVDVHLEDVPVGEPARLRRRRPSINPGGTRGSRARPRRAGTSARPRRGSRPRARGHRSDTSRSPGRRRAGRARRGRARARRSPRPGAERRSGSRPR